MLSLQLTTTLTINYCMIKIICIAIRQVDQMTSNHPLQEHLPPGQGDNIYKNTGKIVLSKYKI